MFINDLEAVMVTKNAPDAKAFISSELRKRIDWKGSVASLDLALRLPVTAWA